MKNGASSLHPNSCRAAPLLALFGAMMLASCAPPAPAADDGADGFRDADHVPSDGEAGLDRADVIADVDDGEAECAWCGTPCEGVEPQCGAICCYGLWEFPPPPGEVRELLCDPWCGMRTAYGGLLSLDYELYPELRGNPALIPLSEYTYRGDGSELIVAGWYGDDWEAEGCIDHCWASGDYVWIVDIPTRRVVYAERFDYLGQALDDFSNMVDALPASDCWSPSAAEEDVGIDCMYRADVPERDEVFYVGYRGRHPVYEWGDPDGPDHRADLPILTNAVDVYGISTGEWLGGLALRLVEPGTSVWHAEAAP